MRMEAYVFGIATFDCLRDFLIEVRNRHYEVLLSFSYNVL